LNPLVIIAQEPDVVLSTTTRLITVLFALLFAAGVMELIRRRRLQEKYTVLWFIYVLLLLAIAVFPVVLTFITREIGISDPNATLFTIGFLGAGLMLLNLTVTVSRQGEQITRLAQEMALMRSELDEIADPSEKDGGRYGSDQVLGDQ